jgi:hypothetical protein
VDDFTEDGVFDMQRGGSASAGYEGRAALPPGAGRLPYSEKPEEQD